MGHGGGEERQQPLQGEGNDMRLTGHDAADGGRKREKETPKRQGWNRQRTCLRL
jgi:hypothetical protein